MTVAQTIRHRNGIVPRVKVPKNRHARVPADAQTGFFQSLQYEALGIVGGQQPKGQQVMPAAHVPFAEWAFLLEIDLVRTYLLKVIVEINLAHENPAVTEVVAPHLAEIQKEPLKL